VNIIETREIEVMKQSLGLKALLKSLDPSSEVAVNI
jgi:hypothetical protein